MTSRSILDNNVQKMHEWINTFYEYSEWYLKDDAQALAVIRATLHELRDNLPINNLAHLSAQLPLMIRGILFEKWNPSHTCQLSP